MKFGVNFVLVTQLKSQRSPKERERERGRRVCTSAKAKNACEGRRKKKRGQGQGAGAWREEDGNKTREWGCLHRALKHGVFCLVFIQKEKEQSMSRE